MKTTHILITFLLFVPLALYGCSSEQTGKKATATGLNRSNDASTNSNANEASSYGRGRGTGGGYGRGRGYGRGHGGGYGRGRGRGRGYGRGTGIGNGGQGRKMGNRARLADGKGRGSISTDKNKDGICDHFAKGEGGMGIRRRDGKGRRGGRGRRGRGFISRNNNRNYDYYEGPATSVTDKTTPNGSKRLVLFPLPKNSKEIKIVEKPVYHKTFKIKDKEYIALNSLKVEGGDKIRGYNENIPLEIVVVFEKSGSIHRVVIGAHKETPSFIEEINKKWIKKFNNLKIEKHIIGKKGKSIDALTENTMSTEAIKKSVDLLRKVFIKNFLKKKPM